MTPAELEAIYDEEIAPALLTLMNRCKDLGMPAFLAYVEWEVGGGGRSVNLSQEAGIGARTVELAMQSHGNIDAFMMAVMRYAEQHGHSSMVIDILERHLGIPTNVIGMRPQDRKPAESEVAK